MHPENAIDNGDFIKILVYKFNLRNLPGNIAIPICICYNADRQKRDGYIVCTPVENPGAATPGFSFWASCHYHCCLTTCR